VGRAVRALRAGEAVVLPTDTVYGLACLPHDEAAVRRLYALKGRRELQPTAVLAASVDGLLTCLPELAGMEPRLRALLPAALTLVVANPARRLPWLCGERPDTIGVRVPRLEPPTADVLADVGAVAATSANLAGGPDPRRLADVPPEILEHAVALDGGELGGVPSTVVDLTGPEPTVLREGAVAARDVLASIRRCP
jgi:L-threonylcarbamoyladenylate synthase